MSGSAVIGDNRINQRFYMNRLLTVALCGALVLLSAVMTRGADAGNLRIIVFGAHPDDCEIQAGGCAALWAAKGHKVKLVSVTNGDIGHWRDAGGPLAKRRKAEVEKADSILGAATGVLDIHDGELLPTLENRRMITRLIREWKADVVISPRPNDYHPDHRYVSILVQDSAYMVTVPFFCPDVPALKKNPVFLYNGDGFQKPNPFQADIAISIDPVLDKKLDALAAIESQFYEGGANGSAALLPSDPAGQAKRRQTVRTGFEQRSKGIANRFRAKLIEFYGEEQGKKITAAEAFEICEYGSRPSTQELKRLFPFFEK
jgi:N-acetylglucosamine malate deacetylase 1